MFRRRRLMSLLVITGLTGALAVVAACVGDDPAAPSPVTADASPSDSDSQAKTDSQAPSDSSTPGEDGALVDAHVPGCDSGVTCGGSCVDTKSDPLNCGGCGVTCASDAGASFACVQGVCGNKAVQVSAGYYGSCAVLLDGTVWCWGRQKSGETGVIDDATPTARPSKIAITDVVEVHAGNSFACARKSDGTVWCWGDNSSGIFGRAPGSETGCAGTCSTTPVQVTLPAKAVQLVASIATVCARTEAAGGSDVYCWGDAYAGILGSTTPDAGTINPTPTKIPVFLGDVLEISLAAYDKGGPGDRPFACALRSDHTVWCWGANFNGGLGHTGGTDTTCTDVGAIACNGTPQKVDGLVNVTHVSVGGTFACAITTTGAAWCWGNNRNGYLANGTFDQTAHPTPSQVAGLNTSAAISASNIATLVSDSTGGVKGWGVNTFGVLALGDYSGTTCSDFACATTAQNVPNLQGVTQISTKYLTGVALKADGTILTWGVNSNAELAHAPNTNGDIACGNGTGACNPTPAPIALPWR